MSIDTSQVAEASTRFTLTYDEYDRMVECGAFDHLQRKIELIRGEISQMNPAGPLHDDLINDLAQWSINTCDQNEFRISIQTGLNLSELDSRPEPDLMWVRNVRYRTGHPTAQDVRLAIEVSYSSIKTDREVKASLYAEANICEYWIVDAVKSCVHVFHDPRDGKYTQERTVKCGETLAPICQADAQLVVSDLFSG